MSPSRPSRKRRNFSVPLALQATRRPAARMQVASVAPDWAVWSTQQTEPCRPFAWGNVMLKLDKLKRNIKSIVDDSETIRRRLHTLAVIERERYYQDLLRNDKYKD